MRACVAWATNGGDDAQVLAAGELRMKARLLDDRAHPCQRRRALGGHGIPETLMLPALA